MSDSPIVVFDGVCNLCEGSVQFIIHRDPGKRYRFAACQSAAGKQLLSAHGLDPDAMDTMILIEHGRIYTRSTAALRIARGLTGLWPVLSVFLILPRLLRDPLYDMVAKNRYRWFGKKEVCMTPSNDVADRFLDKET